MAVRFNLVFFYSIYDIHLKVMMSNSHHPTFQWNVKSEWMQIWRGYHPGHENIEGWVEKNIFCALWKTYLKITPVIVVHEELKKLFIQWIKNDCCWLKWRHLGNNDSSKYTLICSELLKEFITARMIEISSRILLIYIRIKCKYFCWLR